VINFKAIPFLKILFPYLAGILCARYIGIPQNISALCVIAFIILAIAFLFQKFYKPVFYFKKVIYILSVNLFLFVLAFQISFSFNEKNHYDHYTHFVNGSTDTFLGVVDELPVESDKTTKVSLKLLSIKDHDAWKYTKGSVLLYLKKDSSLQLSPGNHLLVNSKFVAISPPKNPHEFDYKTYLEERNVFHTVYATRGQVNIVPNLKSAFSLAFVGLQTKAYLVSVLRSSGLSHDAFSICAALLMGYDEEIDDGIMTSFTHSGTLHILSVSGMHTGVLYTLLIFIFSKLDKSDRYKKLKCLCVILSLLFFVGITGFSPSVLRAVLMLSLVIIGQTFYKRGNSFNTLLLSAFLLLLYSPNLVGDAGFLLSYTAVLGIMYLYPILSRIHAFDHWIPQWFWALVLMSVAATVFTLPVSLFYFHQFPTWFVVTNLIVIPVSLLNMALAVFVLVFSKVAIISQVFVTILNSATAFMLWVASLTDVPGWGFVDNISFSTFDVVCCVVVLILVLLIIERRQFTSVVLAGIAIIFWLSGTLFNQYVKLHDDEFVVFHVKNKPVFMIRQGGKVFGSFDQLAPDEFQRYIKPYLLTIPLLKMDSVRTYSWCTKKHSFTWLNKEMPTSSNVLSDYILVSHNTELPLTTNVKSEALIIADCSNSSNFVRKLKKQCKVLGLRFISIRETGAIQIKL
jgi:competence protein ComEC